MSDAGSAIAVATEEETAVTRMESTSGVPVRRNRRYEIILEARTPLDAEELHPLERPVTTAPDVLAEVLRSRLIAVLRLDSALACRRAAESVAEGGITTLEITLTTPGALAVIRKLSERSDLLVGVGSVRTVVQLHAAADAGARFMASPLTDPDVIAAARSRGMMTMPGALTPTEIDRAWRLGADLVKVFPMPSDGIAYIRSILGPMPEVRLAPSGGVAVSSVEGFLRNGAAALNVGSQLTGNFGDMTEEGMRDRAAALVAAVSQSRQER